MTDFVIKLANPRGFCAGVDRAIEIVERFTLDGDTLVYDFWGYDPATFTEPIDKPGFLVWTWEPGLELETDNCENYYEDP